MKAHEVGHILYLQLALRHAIDTLHNNPDDRHALLIASFMRPLDKNAARADAIVERTIAQMEWERDTLGRAETPLYAGALGHEF